MPKALTKAEEKRAARAAAFLAPKFPTPKERRSSRITGVKIDKKAMAALVELGNKQPTINMKGGVGIPGGRTATDVVGFKALKFPKMAAQLGAILQKSTDVRGSKDIENTRTEVKKVNRQVQFEAGQVGHHSLHVGNDIAAVYNGDKGSKVYDYPKLAQSLDKRLETATKGSKTYWHSADPLETRRGHVATGMQHMIAGNKDHAIASFDNAGLTQQGKKWAFKMSNLMLAEKARETKGGLGGAPVHTALDHVIGGGPVASKSFSDVFVKHADTLAPFSVRGGAKTFK